MVLVNPARSIESGRNIYAIKRVKLARVSFTIISTRPSDKSIYDGAETQTMRQSATTTVTSIISLWQPDMLGSPG